MNPVPFAAEHSETALWACPKCWRVVAKLSEVEWQISFDLFGPAYLCETCIALLTAVGPDPMAGIVTFTGREKTRSATVSP
jgi:hypothetical protein